MSVAAATTPIRAPGLGAATRRVLGAVLFAVFPLAVFVATLVVQRHSPDLGWDLRYSYRHAGLDLLAGRSPHPPADPVLLGGDKEFVYPAPVAVAFVPFALLPEPVAVWLFVALAAAAMVAALLLAGVRDPRCLLLAVTTAPGLQAIGVGTLSTVMALLAAVAWRLRDRPRLCGLALAAMCVAKPYLLPVLLWLVATRRRHALATTVGLGLGALVAWLAIAPHDLLAYPRVLAVITDVDEVRSYSLSALAIRLGVPDLAARLLALVAAAAVAAAALRVARRPDGDRRSFVLAVAAALVASPILWLHYLVVVPVLVGLRRPTFGLPWAALLLLVPAPGSAPDSTLWMVAVQLLFVALVLVAVRPRPLRTASPSLDLDEDGRDGASTSTRRPSPLITAQSETQAATT